MRTSFKLIFLLATFFVSQLRAQSGLDPSNCPASPYAVEITQPDNSKLRVVGKGNMANHHTETEDGYTVVKNGRGIYEYAELKDGKLAPSGTKASNPSARETSSKSFLNSQPKHLRGAIGKSASSNSPLNVNQSNSPGIKYAFPTAGVRKVLVILIKYPDLANTYTGTDFDDMMNEVNYNSTGSFRDYFLKVSDNELDVEADVFGWYEAENNYEYYGDDNGDNVARELVGEAIDAAELAGVDFSIYDNDSDGFVDGVIIVHAGPGAEEGSQTEYIWSHRWTLPGSYGRSYDDVTLYDYMINPEIRQTTNMVGIGVFCHEFGHGLGLPDLYDIDDSNGDSEGIGNWGLMAGAGWLNNERTPGFMSAWSRAQLEWITPTVIGSGDYSLDPSVSSTTVYKIATNDPKEYFLLENRQKTGQDAYIPGEGLAIWHIDDNQTTNGDETHKLVDLEEADGLNGLDNETNRGDAGDLYPGTSSNTLFDDTSNPNAKLYSGSVSNIQVSAIVEDDLQVSFTLLQGDIPNPCEDAISIAGTGSENSETFTGGGEGDWDLALCESSAPGIEQIYSFVAPSTGLYSLEITSATGTIDYAWNTACGPTGWVCIGDIEAIGTYGSMSLTGGETYYLLLDDEDDGTGSSHQFYLNEPTTPCENIIEIAGTGSGNSKIYSGGGTGLWNTEFCDWSTPGIEQIYSFTPETTGYYNIEVTSADGYVDYGWSTSCSESGWQCIDDIAISGTYDFLFWTEGVTYYLLLDDEDNEVGAHEFYISGPFLEGTVCESIVEITGTGSENDQTFSGSGTGQWNSGFCNYDTPGLEQVYSFTAPTSGTYSIQVTAASGWIDYAWGTSCGLPGWECIEDVESPGTYGQMLWTGGTTYYILLDYEDTDPGEHTFHITEPVSPCDNVVEIAGTGATNTTTYTGGGSGYWNEQLCFLYSPGVEQIYSFTAPSTGTYSVVVTAASGYVDYAWNTSCDLSGWECIEELNSPGTYGTMSWTEGTTYYLLLDDTNTSTGTHEFYISEPVLGPCELAIEITGAGSANSVVFAGGGSGQWNNGFCNWSTPGVEQVYSFVAPYTGNYSITVSSGTGYVDYAWGTSCSSSVGGWNCIDDINSPGTYGSLSWIQGTTYYLLLDDENSTASNHEFHINIPEGEGSPEIEVTPTSLMQTVTEGSSGSKEFTIQNTGDNELTFSIAPAEDWISVDPISGTVGAGESVLITVTFDAAILTPDTYTSDITISSNDDDEPETVVTTSLTVEELIEYTISLAASPEEGGEVTGAGVYDEDESVEVSATAAAGYAFLDWTEGAIEVSDNAVYSFTATGDRSLVANFEEVISIAATASPSAGGSVTGQGDFSPGATVSLTATASEGYNFVNWTEGGTEISTETTLSFTASVDRSLVANFQIQSFVISAAGLPSTGGSVTGSGTFEYGVLVSLIATPEAGYSFINWTEAGSEVATTTTFTFTATGDRSLVANFEEVIGIAATASPSAGGTVTGQGDFSPGAAVNLTATASEGYNFVNWTESGTEVSTETALSFTASVDRTLVANFQIQSFTISATESPSEGGKVTGTGSYNYGETVDLLAMPEEHYSFSGWEEDGSAVGSGGEYSFTASKDRNLVAKFEKQYFFIVAGAGEAGTGTVAGAGQYNFGETATLTATPAVGYEFVNWTEVTHFPDEEKEISTDPILSIVVSEGKILRANFQLKTFTIAVQANPIEGGEVLGGSFKYHQLIGVTATPSTGYNFVNWTENGEEVDKNLFYQFEVTNDRNLVANFELKSFEVTASASPTEGGAVEGTGTFNFGTTVTLTANPAASFEFVNWTENGSEVGTNPALSFAAEGNRSLVANFEFNPSTSVKWEAELATIYPNPVTDYLTVEMDDFVQALVFELTGKEIQRSTSKSLDLRDLQPGMYLIKLEDSERRQRSFRVIKE